MGEKGTPKVRFRYCFFTINTSEDFLAKCLTKLIKICQKTREKKLQKILLRYQFVTYVHPEEIFGCVSSATARKL